MSSERALQRRVLRYLRTRGGWWRKLSPLPYGGTGDPDIVGCYMGRFVAFELKLPGRKPTKLQEQALSCITASGGTGIVAYSLDDVISTLNRIEKEVGCGDPTARKKGAHRAGASG